MRIHSVLEDDLAQGGTGQVGLIKPNVIMRTFKTNTHRDETKL